MRDKEVWEDGFKAGEALDGLPCPHQPGTHEAWIWQKGWIEGASKRIGYSYAKEYLETHNKKTADPS